MSNDTIPQFVGSLTTEQLTELFRKVVREELTERGYAAEHEVMNKEQLAKLFDVTTRTVTNWMAREGLPHKKGPGGMVSFLREEIAAWSKEHGVAMRGRAA